MRPIHLTLAATLISAAALTSGCVIREVRTCPGPYPECKDEGPVDPPIRSQGLAIGAPGETYADTLPPEPLEESVPELDDGQVWIDGYWHWNGTEWVWLEGRAVGSPGEDYVYVEPSYDVAGDTCVYTPGYWDYGYRLPDDYVVTRDRWRPPRVRHRRRHLRDHRSHVFGNRATRASVRDHRDRVYVPHQRTRPAVRDHRDRIYHPRHTSTRPAVRDHRGNDDFGRPHVRDHRDHHDTSGRPVTELPPGRDRPPVAQDPRFTPPPPREPVTRRGTRTVGRRPPTRAPGSGRPATPRRSRTYTYWGSVRRPPTRAGHPATRPARPPRPTRPPTATAPRGSPPVMAPRTYPRVRTAPRPRTAPRSRSHAAPRSRSHTAPRSRSHAAPRSRSHAAPRRRSGGRRH